MGISWIRRYWTAFSFVILALGALWMALTPPAREAATGGQIPAPKEGFLAPDFALPDANGRTVRLSELRGKPVLVNIWASWCPPCKEEMPAMQAAYAAYAAQGFTILAVNATFSDTQQTALDFARGRNLTFPILFDQDGQVSAQYQVQAMPSSFFIDRQGVIRRVVIGGPMTKALIIAEIEPLLSGSE